MIVFRLADIAESLARLQEDVASRFPRPVEPTVLSFRPLATATRHPPWEPESVIVDDLGVAPRRRERRVK